MTKLEKVSIKGNFIYNSSDAYYLLIKYTVSW